MLTTSNTLVLVSLGVTSWLILCLINPHVPHESQIFENDGKLYQGISRPFRIWSARSLASLIYITCTAIGVYLLINVLSRKLRFHHLFQSWQKSAGNLLPYVVELEAEVAKLRDSLKQHEMEKQILLERLNIKVIINKKLKTDLEKICNRKLNLYSGYSEEFDNISFNSEEPSIVINHYCRPDSKELETNGNYLSAHTKSDLIHQALKKIVDLDTQSNEENSPKPTILKGGWEKGDQNISSNYETSLRLDNEKINSVNVVTTHELEQIKGLALPQLKKIEKVWRLFEI